MKYFVFFLLALSTTLQAESTKIGYINIDHIVKSSPQFIQANQAVIERFEPKEKQLLDLGEQLQSLVDQYNNNAKSLSKDERTTQLKKISALENNLKQQALTLKNQLKQVNEQELSKIQDLINQVVKEIAINQNFDLILYQEVAYASQSVNITSLVSQKLREIFK